jgi:hypothetical protein
MLELSNIGHSGLLSEFIQEPPIFLSTLNGVVGVALSYDITLVNAVAYRVSRDFPWMSPTTIEYSALVAERLAATSQWQESETTAPSEDFQELFEWWSAFCQLRFGRYVSPVVVEISIGPEFPRESEHVEQLEFGRGTIFAGAHRVVLRRTKQPQTA